MSVFASLERDLDQIIREQVANRAKAVALGMSADPDKHIREYLSGDFW